VSTPHLSTPPRRPAALALLALLTALALAAGSCGVLDERTSARPGPRYPTGIERGEVFDVQVFRDVTVIRFTNTTTRDFGPSRLWLNQRYSSALGAGIGSGETLELDLRGFVDEFGDTYRAGGFFATRVPAPVVLVELQTGPPEEPLMHGFVVVENQYD